MKSLTIPQLKKDETIQWPKESKKGQNLIYKTLHRKVTSEQHEPHGHHGWTQVPQNSTRFRLHLWHPPVTLVTNRLTSHEWVKTGLQLQQTEHIHGNLWRMYSVTSNDLGLLINIFVSSKLHLAKSWWRS